MMNKKILHLLTCFIMLTSSWAQTSKTSMQPQWNDELDFEAIEHRLKNEAVVSVKGMADYLQENNKATRADNEVKLIVLESGLKAVFKTGDYRYAEVAAYKGNRAVGQRLVPPTVLRTIGDEEGSLQFFVESSLDILRVSDRSSYYKKLDPKEWSAMQIFYFVFGQWDIHAGNQIIVESKGKYLLALIDNAGILHRQQVRYGEFPFVGKGRNNTEVPDPEYCPTFPFDDPKRVPAGSYKRLHALFSPYIDDYQVRYMIDPGSEIIYAIWHHSLWVQINADSGLKPTYTDTYYASTLEAYKKLDRTILREVWSDGLKVEAEWYEELIELTLQRRDQLIHAAETTGTIIK